MIELMTFRLVKGKHKGAFVAADTKVQTEYAPHQPGLLRRTTAHTSDDEWVCIIHWRTPKDEEAANAVWGQDDATKEFDEFIDADTIVTKRYDALGGHLGSI